MSITPHFDIPFRFSTPDSLATLDDATRPDENPLSRVGFWTYDLVLYGPPLVLKNGLISGGPEWGISLHVGGFSNNMQTWVSIAKLPDPPNGSIDISVREDGTGQNAYYVELGFDNVLTLKRAVVGVETNLLLLGPGLITTDDIMGLTGIGTTISVWRRRGADLTVLGSIVDTSLAGPGGLAIGMDYTSSLYFIGGGSIPAGVMQPGPIPVATPIAMQVGQDTIEDITNCVEAILRTQIGSRMFVPNFGIPDLAFNMQPIDIGAITQQVVVNEPRARVLLHQNPLALDKLVADIVVEVAKNA
jgi:hypothetical protein